MIGLITLEISVGEWSKKVAVYKPGRELSSGTTSADTLFLDFLDFKPVEYRFLLFKPPILWCFVMAAE